MGYRLHYAKTYKVKWSVSGNFSHNSEEVNTLLRELCPDMIDNNDVDTAYADELEIKREDIKKAIKTLKKWKKENKSPQLWMLADDYTWDDIIEFLEDALKNSDSENDFVKFCWY